MRQLRQQQNFCDTTSDLYQLTPNVYTAHGPSLYDYEVEFVWRQSQYAVPHWLSQCSDYFYTW